MGKSDIPLTRSRVKDRAIAFLHPLRRPVTWACQHRLLPLRVRRLLPWRWAVEPFTIYGNGWKCQWYPAEFDDITHTIFWSGLHDYEKETIPVMLDQISASALLHRCWCRLRNIYRFGSDDQPERADCRH